MALTGCGNPVVVFGLYLSPAASGGTDLIKLEDALTVREHVLNREGEVELGSGVVNGNAYRCWYIRSVSWHARVTNLADYRSASGRAEGDDGIEDDQAVNYERLEVFMPAAGEKSVFEFLYRIGEKDARFLHYGPGRWAGLAFGIGAAPEEPPEVRKAKTLAFMSRGLPSTAEASLN